MEVMIRRTMSKLLNNGVPEKTTYYNGGYGKEVSPGNNIRQLHYIEGGDGLAAVFVRNNGQDTMYYIHKDHLGSINVITDQNGAVIQNCSFDAWGRRRNPADWSYNNVPESFFLDRGFTGHEHLDQFGLINMNGRVYDPAIARFLSPDNFVQSPYLTQAFNRYTYCLNNPLKYTDPSGMEYGVGPIYNERWFRNKHRLNDMDGRGGYTYNDQTGYYYNGGGSSGSYGSGVIHLMILITYGTLNIGGYWSSYTGGVLYKNEDQAYFATCNYIDSYGYWGNTEPKSYANAESAYILMQSQGYYTASLDGGPAKTYSLYDNAPKHDFSGFWGGLKYFFTGGYVGGYSYNIKGEVTGLAPITGMAPTPGFKGNINPNFLIQLEKQFAKDGINSIYKSYRSLQKNLLEHQERLKDILIKSSVEREIRTWQRDLRTIEEFLKRLGQ